MKSLTSTERVEELANEIYAARNKFFKASLTQLVAFKCFLGRKLANESDPTIGAIASKTGISEAILYDSKKMYLTENLTPQKEKQFIKVFQESYSSWNDYRKEVLYPSLSVDNNENDIKCKNCPIHCK